MQHCLHCQSPTANSTFCCAGCKVAYGFIKSLDLLQHYDYCRKIFNAKPQTVEIVESDIDWQTYIMQDQTLESTILYIPEIFCGACAWLIENAFRRLDGIECAEVNLTYKTLKISWTRKKHTITDIVKRINKLGYNCIPFEQDQWLLQQNKAATLLLRRIGIAALGFMFVMMLSVSIWAGNLDGSITTYTKSLFHLITYIITMPIALYTAYPFLCRAWRAVQNRSADMNIPISIAIIMTLYISMQQTFVGGSFAYYDSALGLILALLTGRFLEHKVHNKAVYESNQALHGSSVFVRVQSDQGIIKRLISSLKKGEILLISAGEYIPVDGVLLCEYGQINNQVITGESLPVTLQKGAQLYAGSINVGDAIKVLCSAQADQSYAQKLRALVGNIKKDPSPYTVIASKITAFYTPIVLLLAVITFAYWHFLVQQSIYEALYIATSLLVITCPCAVGIAVPLANFIVSNFGVKHGIYIKNSTAIEKLPQIKSVFYDKTGTLTDGNFAVQLPKELSSEDQNVLYSMSVLSSHPISRAIAAAITDGKQKDLRVMELKGYGLSAYYNGIEYKLGSARYVQYENDNSDTKRVYFKVGDRVYGILLIDRLRLNVAAVVKFFAGINIRQSIVSGDNKAMVKKLAAELGVQQYYYEADPMQKLHIMQQEKQMHAFVGDGINDSAVMKAASISISHSGGSSITKDVADIVWTGNDFGKIALLYRQATKYRKVVIQSFTLSFIYNIVSVPLAFLGYVTPIHAAIFMSLSSICVILNSLRLRYE